MVVVVDVMWRWWVWGDGWCGVVGVGWWWVWGGGGYGVVVVGVG